MKSISRPKAVFPAILALASISGCLDGEVVNSSTSAPPDPGGTTNGSPTISGNPPAAIRVGEAYSFTPAASDPDGDTLTFSIQNKPNWADFDTATGGISGVPTLGDVGSYANIGLSVSDGQLTASMSTFAVDVTQVATASATLSWSAPTQNEDGSVLTDLAGYKIFYGQSSGNYTTEIRIDNPSVTTYVVENLSPATYFFTAKSFNTSGVDSRYSGEAVKTLN